MDRNVVPDSVTQQLSEYVAERMGLHFPRARWMDLHRGLASAVRELGFSDLTTGAEWLLSAPLAKKDLDVLASHLTIGETYFFREKRTFEVLGEEILPQLTEERRRTGNRRLRIWSAACCTGEEPYSLAILLKERIHDLSDWNVTILATDINTHFLKKATTGSYRDWSFRETPVTIKHRYFNQHSDGSYVLVPEIRELVTFSQLNLVEDLFPSLAATTNAMDLILCRNVLMYFSPAQARKVVANLYRAIVNDGWLLVSSTETSQTLFNEFTTVNFPGATFYRRSVRTYQPEPSQIPTVIAEPPPVTFDYQVKHRPISRESKASRDVLAVPDAKTFSSLTRSLADQGKLKDALLACDRWIEAEKLNAAAHYLRAIVLQELGEVDQARASLQKAIYLEPELVLAYFTLGNLSRARGKRVEARRNFANALSLLERLPVDEVLPESDGLTAGRLAEIITSVIAMEAT